MSASEVAIRVANVSKRYRIGELNTHSTLREMLANAMSRPAQKLRSRINGVKQPPAEQIFLALEDVSFEVEAGEVLGLIGRNGAGKSTLLKILSRITEPSNGRVEMYGRVGSLLEVGTGFHPELTGRENIFLNGAILGMTRAEIRRKFDEIVSFAEIEKFLDTPVKRYSSGMYVRLAFAVAAHLEPEILLVDEVLAVGDTAFQKKCLGKMGEVARQGRTVVFVSHNVSAIRSLCSRAIMLRQGRIFSDGPAAETVSEYLAMLEGTISNDLFDRQDRTGVGQIRFKSIEIGQSEANSSSVLSTGQPARFIFRVSDVRPAMACAFTIYDYIGQPITHLNSTVQSTRDSRDSGDGARFICRIDELMLVPGRYRINAALWTSEGLQDHVEGAAFFMVEQGSIGGRSAVAAEGFGNVLFHHRWVHP